MAKKYAQIGTLVILVALAISAFSPYKLYKNQRDLSNFRKAHMWNGWYIPSMDVTSTLTDPPSVVSFAGTNFRTSNLWNGRYIPSVSMTGVLSDSVSNDGPVIPVTGSDTTKNTPVKKWNSGH
jgi:hypothetical protein